MPLSLFYPFRHFSRIAAGAVSAINFYALVIALLLCCFSTTLRAQVAGFTVDKASGCAPLVCRFTNTSSGATSYSWDLGNSTTTSVTDPSGVYTSVGSYTVTLTAFNGTATSIRTMVISVFPPPDVSFFASDTAICPGRSITFTSTTLAGAPGPLLYTWNFGDGNSSTATSPVYNYPTPGRYNVTLFATNSAGCISSASIVRYIHIYTPAIPGFSAPNFACSAPALIPFTNTTSGGGPFSYLWYFGDGGTSTTAAPVHTYTASGSYDILLQVTDGKGCIDTLKRLNAVAVDSTKARFTSPSTGCRYQPLSFSNTSSPHTATRWYFGDGSIATTDVAVHSYSVNGVFSVKMVMYKSPCADSVTHFVTIATPTGSFTITPPAPCPLPRSVTFNAAVASGTTVDWYSFAHGFMGSGTTFTHLFPNDAPSGQGGFIDSFSMVITNSSGCKDTIAKLDTVNGLYLLVNPTPRLGCIPLTCNFSTQLNSGVRNIFAGSPFFRFGPIPPMALYTYFPYPYAGATYAWNFGDGSPTATSSLPTPTHTYTATGYYRVTCAITTINGCSVSSFDTVQCGSPPPAPTFTMSTTRACAGSGILFTGTGSGVFTSYNWEFGDSKTANGSPFTYTYDIPGTYAPRLYLIDKGCPGPYFVLHDTIDSPAAALTYTFACTPRSKLLFTSTSMGDDTRLWQFGDGSTSTIIAPTHTYSTLGTYNIILSTFNTRSACRDTAFQKVNLNKLTSSITPSRTSLCRNAPDTLVAYVVDTAYVSTSWAEKFRWYADALLIDTLSYNEHYDTAIKAFTTVGSHAISLVLTDNHGCLDTARTNILAAKPVASFSFTPTVTCASTGIAYTDISTDVTTLASYAWQFGDAATSSAGAAVTHIYTTAGSYTISSVVTDNLGCKDTFTSPVHLVIHKPSASFVASLTSSCVGFSINFANTSVSASRSFWTFGDGDTSTASSPDHVYLSPGTFTVRLIINDPSGCADTSLMVGYVVVNPIPSATFYLDDSFTICPPLNVNCINTSTAATAYFWDLGDGTASVITSPNAIYTTPGRYKIKLTATNEFGCPDTAIAFANIFGYAGAFSYTPLTGCSPLPVHFRATLAGATSVLWDFNDGYTSSASLSDTISHLYNTPGLYVPKLILTDTSGCSNFSIGADTIKAGMITSTFSVTPNPVCKNNSTSFHETSFSFSSTIVSRLWTFAPGNTSILPSPSFTYSTAGTFPVTLKVTDGVGCIKTTSVNVTVLSLPPPIAGASICVGSTATLIASGGTWASGNTAIATINSTTGDVTGVASGVTNITFTMSSGCISTTTVSVYTVPGITGLSSVCEGQVILLANATPGGSWSSGNTTVATVGGTGAVRAVAAGTTTITYLVVAGCYTTKTITVLPAPAAITGNTHVCVGMSEPLFDTDPGGAWTSNNTGVASVNPTTGLVTGMGTGLATIFYTLTTGCGISVTETVSPPPAAIGGVSQVCEGAAITLTNGVSGGAWTSSNTSVATMATSSGLVTGVSAGTTVISYSLGSGCATTKVVTVNTMPSAIAGPSSLCVGLSYTLTNSVPGGNWTSSNSSIASIGSAAGIVSGLFASTATISYTIGSSCRATSVLTVFAVPAPVSGGSFVCEGSAVAFTDPTAGGTWATSSAATGSISAGGVLTGVLAGSVVVTYATGPGCIATKPVTVNPAPAIQTVTGGGTICAGDAGLPVGLSGSEVGVNYQLFRGSTPSGTAVAGTGSPLGFGILTVAGTYTVSATSTAGSCSRNMPGSAVIVINSSPAVQTVLGGGGYCTGDTGVTISLSGSQTGIHYQLYNGSSAIGAPLTGTGSVLLFGTFTAAGTYTVNATNITTFCTAPMLGSAVITINPLPVVQTITGGGAYCAGTGGAAIGLSGSQVGINYQLYNGAAPSGAAVAGTGSPLSFGLISATGSYTVSATNAATSCTSNMAGSVVITVNAQPNDHVLSGGGHICAGDPGLNLTLAGSDVGINYQLLAGVTAVGAAVAGTGSPLSFGPLTTGGIYTIVATDATTLCTATMTGTVTIAADPLPVPQHITGGGSYCEGTGGVPIGLSSSETVVQYQLYAGAATAGATVGGSGSAISFGTFVVAGVYKAVATNTATGCTAAMPDSTVVSILQQPVAGNISGSSSLCQGATIILTDTAAGGIWSATNSNAAVVNGSVTGIINGIDTINYTVTNICGTAVATRELTILEAAKVHITTHPGNDLCNNTQFQNFGAEYAPPTGTSYIWTADNGAIYAISPGGQYCLVSFYGTGITRIMLAARTDATGCVSTDTFNATVQTYPARNPEVVYSYPMLICLDNIVDNYQWGYDDRISLDSTVLEAERNQNYYNPNLDLDNKFYWVITNHHGCIQKSYYNLPAKTGTALAGVPDVRIYPNPADDVVNVEIGKTAFLGDVDIILYDNFGKKRMNRPIFDHKASFDISLLPPGLYYILLSSNGAKVASATFIKR